MMFKKSTFNMTYIGEIFTKILVLPYVGKELNMIIMLPDENVNLETVMNAKEQLCCDGKEITLAFLLSSFPHFPITFLK